MMQMLRILKEKTWLLLPVMLLLAWVTLAPGDTGTEPGPSSDIDEINAVIDAFEDAYSNKQLNDLRQLFYAEAVIAFDTSAGDIQRIYGLEDWLQNTQEYTFTLNRFISDELTNREIEVFRNIGYVVCDYRYEDDEDLGIGVDIFPLMKMRDRWRILSLQFTGDEGPKR